MWLFALFIAVPLIEISLFVTVGGWLTLWPSLAIVLGTALAGVFLLRLQGTKGLARLQENAGALQDPLSPLAHGAMIMFAAILLILPGFFTDSLGLILLFPPVRLLLIRWIARRANVATLAARFSHRSGRAGAPMRDAASGDLIDGDFQVIGDAQNDNRPPSGWTRG